MARISRKTQQIFAGELVAANNLAKFGSLRIGAPAYSLDPEELQTTEYLNGWSAALLSNKAPALQDLNALHYLHSYQTAYLMQTGIPEWDDGTTYFVGSTATDAAGKQYVCIMDHAAGAGALTNTACWKPHGPSIPLGGVIATFPNLTGAYQCAATTIADAEGFVLCNGQTISDAQCPMNGVVVPNINDDVFLMGSTTAGTAGGANTLNLEHTHPLSVSGSVTMPAHTHTLNNYGGAKGREASGYSGGVDIWMDRHGPAYSGGDDYLITNVNNILSASGGSYPFTMGLTGRTDAITATAPSVGFTSTGTSGNGLSPTQDIRPKYISAVYLMRVK